MQPDYTLPTLVKAEVPSKDEDGNYNGMELCMEKIGFDPKPPAPYGPENANADMSKTVEEGFRLVQGYLTEGRFLVLEQGGYALTNTGGSDVVLTAATAAHESKSQRWVVHTTGGAATDGGAGATTSSLLVSSAADGRYLASHTSLSTASSGAQEYQVEFLGNGKGYSLQKENGKYLGIKDGEIYISSEVSGWQIYSVSYLS
jgi:phospholipase C